MAIQKFRLAAVVMTAAVVGVGVVLAGSRGEPTGQPTQPKGDGTGTSPAKEIERATGDGSVGYARSGPEEPRAEYKALFVKAVGVLAEHFEQITRADQYDGRIEARQPVGKRQAFVEIRRVDDGRLAVSVRVLQEAADGKPADRDTELERVILRQLGAEPAPELSKGKGTKLWAAISVNQPVFLLHEETAPGLFQLQFTVVNDGDAAIDPELEGSQLIINGKELKDWRFVISNGPRTAEWKAIPPGRYIQFGYAMGKYFDEPGIYTVSWKGKKFQSPEIVFRVMPKKVN